MNRPRPIAPEFPGNKTEERYAGHLELLKRAGEIVDYRFQPIKLRLAGNTFYEIDFMVITDVVEMVDVKGRKGDRYWAEEDSKIKIKVASQQYPWFRFVITWPLKGGGWGREEF